MSDQTPYGQRPVTRNDALFMICAAILADSALNKDGILFAYFMGLFGLS